MALSWSAHERTALVTASRVSASLGILGAAFVLIAGAFASRFARGRTFIFVRRIALCDFGFALAALFGDLGAGRPLDDPSTACVTQGVCIQLFGVAGAMWSAIVAKELRDACRRALSSASALARRATTYDVVVWGLCVVLAGAVSLANAYGDSKLGRCHVKHGDGTESRSPRTNAYARLFAYYLPIWACVACNLYCWREVAMAMASVRGLRARLAVDSDGARAARRLVAFTTRLAAYPVAQVATNVPGTIFRATTAFGRKNPSAALACAHVVAKTSQGLIHACIFIVAHPARRELVIAVAQNVGAARFLPRAWGVDADGVARADAQTGGVDSIVADDVDLVSDEEDGDRDGFVVLARAEDDDGEVELSTFIGRDAAHSDEPACRDSGADAPRAYS